MFESVDFELVLSVFDNEGEFDLLLFDFVLLGIDGFVGLDILCWCYLVMLVVVVLVFDDMLIVMCVFNFGVFGFIFKVFFGEVLFLVVCEVLVGNIFRLSG